VTDAPDPGVVYVIHFDEAYKHARHYIGWTNDLDARLLAHARGAGARLMEVIKNAGITWCVSRTRVGDRGSERRLKNRGMVQRCPVCNGQSPRYEVVPAPEYQPGGVLP
jgi:predicted GIY-YIG superfamily endonuclease